MDPPSQALDVIDTGSAAAANASSAAVNVCNVVIGASSF
jgi:hypothetical protein